MSFRSISALAQDNNVWTGHARGAVRVRQKQHWELIFEDKAFTSAVRVIVFDDQVRAALLQAVAVPESGAWHGAGHKGTW